MIAADTARKLGSTFHSYQLAGDFFKDFEYHFQYIDQPFGISSGLSLGRISEMAQSNIKVVLSGDGADELFAGYTRHEPYWQPPFLEKIPARFQSTVVATAAKLTRRKSLMELNEHLKLTNGEKFLSRTQVLSPVVVASLLSGDVMKQVDTRRYINRLDSYYTKRKDSDEINRMLYVDVKTTLVDEMLTKCDRMTMRHKIEGRVPFLDHRFVEFAFRIPSSLKRRDGVGKVLLRKMLASQLGNELAYRKKTGFNSPLKQWLQNNTETRTYAKEKLGQISPGYFNAATLGMINNDVGAADPNAIFYLLSASPFLAK
jgi:asparagine synthase (glutamine-hydrolysing)